MGEMGMGRKAEKDCKAVEEEEGREEKRKIELGRKADVVAAATTTVASVDWSVMDRLRWG
jgi:hypothetical protein